MEHRDAANLVALLSAAFPGRSIPDETVGLYVDELVPLSCGRCAYNAVRTLIREVRFFPALAEVLDAYFDEARVTHRSHDPKPELPEKASWTAEDERAAEAAAQRVFAEFRDWRRQHPETPAEAVAEVVAEQPVRDHPSDEEIERRRAAALAALRASYAEELATEHDRKDAG